MELARRRLCGVILVAAVSLTGCGGLPGFGSSSSAAPSQPAAPTIAATPSAKPSEDAGSAAPQPARRNDLAAGAVKRSFKAAGMTVNASYSSPLPAAQWRSEVAKPLNVSLSAFANSSRQQKIYLTRVRANVVVSDDAGPLDSPEPLVDAANISPGFIVTSPYTYGQVFTIPVVDDGATSLTIDFTYEFLLQVTPNSKDYAKQTARDTLTVAVV